ncbi:MAG: RNA polymerase sigma factor [Bacteroidota bacterium]
MNITVDTQELELVKQGDKTLLKSLYKKHRNSFVRWAQWKYPGEGDLFDIYQQAFTIFYYNVKEGKFNGLSSSIQTYLFGIGKNLLNKKLQRKVAMEPLEDIQEAELPTDTIFEQYEATHRQMLVKAVLENIGEPCRSILVKYYYGNFTMEAIAENLGYKTAMVVKKKKCECLMKIRKALQAKSMEIKLENE